MRKEELALKAMIAQNSALGQVVKHVSAGMHGGEASQEDHLSALTMAANDCLAASREYTKHVDPERFNACIPIHATKTAQKTFDVPELLEMILEKGDLGDILGMQCVNRQMRDAVANSIVLQRKLGFAPQASPDLHVPLLEFWSPGLNVYMRSVFDSEVEDEDDAEGHAIVIVGVRLRCKPMRVGEACRRIPIAQPPITAMRETVDCCTAHGYRNAPQLTNANGITVGDIVDRAITLARLYVNCPEAEIDQHDPVSGEVKVGVTFQARLKIAKKKASQMGLLPGDMDDVPASARLVAYVAAKKSAHEAGTPIPVFAEWRKEYDQSGDAEI